MKRSYLLFLYLLLQAFGVVAQVKTDAALNTEITNLIVGRTYRSDYREIVDRDLITSKVNRQDYLTVTASGTNTYTATPAPVLTSYVTGYSIKVIFTNANSGASTINLNGLGAIPLVKEGSIALLSGDIKAGEVKWLVYDGTNFHVLGGSGGGAISSLTPAIATNTINNINFKQEWQWNSLAASEALKLSSTSTLIDHTPGTNGLFSITMAGAMASSKTAIGLHSKLTTTGTTSKNIAGYYEASGATTNLSLQTVGNNLFGGTSGDVITANTRIDTRGQGTTTAFIQRWANSANTTRLTLTDAGSLALTGALSVTGTGSIVLQGSGQTFIAQTQFANAYIKVDDTGTGSAELSTQSNANRVKVSENNAIEIGGFKIVTTQPALNASWTSALRVNPGAHTGIPAGQEHISNDFNGAIQQWATGALTTQRFNYFRAFTMNFVGSSTVTDAYGSYFEAPVVGTNATITNDWSAGFTGGGLKVTGRGTTTSYLFYGADSGNQETFSVTDNGTGFFRNATNIGRAFNGSRGINVGAPNDTHPSIWISNANGGPPLNIGAFANGGYATNQGLAELSFNVSTVGSGSGRIVFLSNTVSTSFTYLRNRAVVTDLTPTSPSTNTLLDLSSTTKGFLSPRLTTTQRNAIASGVVGAIGITEIFGGQGGTGYGIVATYTNVPLTGGTGTGAQATVQVGSGGVVASALITTAGTGYTLGDVLIPNNASMAGTGSGAQATVTSLTLPEGLEVYNTTTKTKDYFNGTAWVAMATGGGPAWLLPSGGTLTGPNTITGTTTNTLKFVFNSLGVTQTNGAGLWLSNTTAATVGAQQISPSIVWEGQGWKTDATAASQSVKFLAEVLPVQAAAAPAGSWRLKSSINGAAYSTDNLISGTSEGLVQLGDQTGTRYAKLIVDGSTGQGTININPYHTATVTHIAQSQLLFDLFNGVVFASSNTDLFRIRDQTNNYFVVRGDGSTTLLQGNNASLTHRPTLTVVAGAHTNSPASLENTDIDFNLTGTKQWATGAITTQRDFRIRQRTYSFVGSSTVTTAATFAIDGAPVSGTNAIITNPYALWVQSGLSRFDGSIQTSVIAHFGSTINMGGGLVNGGAITWTNFGTGINNNAQLSGDGNAGTMKAVFQGGILFTNVSGDTPLSALTYIKQTKGAFSASSGTTTFYVEPVNPAYNFTGSYAGIVYGRDYNPTLTSMTGVTHLAWRNTSGQLLFGGTTITAGSILADFQSTTGGLVLPRMSTTQVDALTPVNGMMVYETTSENKISIYENGGWRRTATINRGVTTGSYTYPHFLDGTGRLANSSALYNSSSAPNIGIGESNPTARLHLAAGAASVGNAPLKFTSGIALTTPADGAVEYHSSHLYFTIGSTRYQLDQQAGGGDMILASAQTSTGKKTFTTGTTSAGLNITSNSPSTPVDGDFWLNGSLFNFRAASQTWVVAKQVTGSASQLAFFNGSDGSLNGSGLITYSGLIGGAGGLMLGDGSTVGYLSGYNNASLNGQTLTVMGGDGGTTNKNGGTLNLVSGAPTGSGTEASVNIQTRSTGKIGFFNATAVVKQSAVTTAQGIADVLTAYGLLPSSTIGASNLTVGSSTITSGTSTRIPFNDGGIYGEDSGLTWDKTNNALTINSMVLMSPGTENTFVGLSSGTTSVSGTTNTGIGHSSLGAIAGGGANVAVGDQALLAVSSGNSNVAVGKRALAAVSTNSSNTALGHLAGQIITGSNNLTLGWSAGDNITSGSNNIVIGYDIDAQSATASNQLSFQNAIFGSGNSGSGTTVSTGNLGFWATSWGTSASKVLAWGGGTGPSTSPADMIQLWVEDVSSSAELRVRDEANNITTLSPHNFSGIPEGPSEEMAWSYYSEKDGKRINVDMLKAIRLLEKLTGEKLVYITESK